MQITRRDVLRRLSGLSALAAVISSLRLVVGGSQVDEDPSVLGRQAQARRDTPAVTAPGQVRHDHGANTTSTDDESQTTDTSSSGESLTTDTSSTTSQPQTSTTEPTTQIVSAHTDLVGSIGPLTVPSGTVATIVGDVSLAGDLMIEGTLTGIDTFTLEGNGFQIMVMRGGTIELAGKAKTGWARVGERVNGWVSGDKVAIAPTGIGVYQPTEAAWGGSWGSVPTPPAVTLLDGRVMQAEVANLTRSITIRNLTRFMFHEGAGRSHISHIAIDRCGKNELGFYPIHFHLNGNSVGGTTVEGVVVMNSANRAFVPHGSNGIKFRDCVAYRIAKRAYWWDEGPGNQSTGIGYEKCLAMWVFPGPGGEERSRLAGFQQGGARGSSTVDCAAVCIQGQADSGGYWWPGGDGESLEPWTFRRNVSHNNEGHGFIVWQNTDNHHFLEQSVAYRNQRGGIHHGAYRNPYRFSDLILQENQGGQAVLLHANAKDSGMLFENIRTDGILWIDKHNLPPQGPNVHRRVTYAGVVYDETGDFPSFQVFEDTGLAADLFDLSRIHPESTISIVEAGVLVKSWASGSWS